VIANPCLRCGACCAYSRASFYWGEADDTTPNGVPVDLTDDLTAFRSVMIGTNGKEPRCVALHGEIGKDVFCTIYDRRPSVCRSFAPSYAEGEPNPDCDKARRAHGLVPLTPEDWIMTDVETPHRRKPTRRRRFRRAA
jgi:Fe-S-cluster containining protein